MKIRDILKMRNRPPITIRFEETVFSAIQKLNKFDRGALPVVDDKDELVGIISERDVVRRCFTPEGQFNNDMIKNIMTREVAVGSLDDDLEYAVSVMRQ